MRTPRRGHEIARMQGEEEKRKMGTRGECVLREVEWKPGVDHRFEDCIVSGINFWLKDTAEQSLSFFFLEPR